MFCLVIRQKPPKYEISVSLDAELYIMIKDTDIKKDIHKIYGISLYKRVMSLYIKCNEKDTQNNNNDIIFDFILLLNKAIIINVAKLQ